ncbi:hypothetical protein CRG98_030737 [Punica granatum]|uniref:Integrase catalytic domain-containing protein n=1 Tax=Punica granatum TaxID=22663 RepID=A0A2I0IXZ9_PUNGR|nr:hypothetical protein CRG98_030737 [Punica granatum]
MEESTGSMFKFNATNYSIWKSRMEDLLFCRDLYDPIEGDSAKPKDKDDKAWERINRKTIGLIRQWIDNSIYHHVAQETNAKALRDKLTNLYARKTPQNKAFLVKKLVHLRYQDGGDMAVHMSNFQDIVNQLTNLEITLPDELQACLLLGTLSDNWDILVVALSNSAPNGKLSLVMDSTWVADISTSFHITPHRDFFSSYTTGDYDTELSCKLLLKKVRHVPEIRLNLISTGQLDDEGYGNEFSNGRWKLSKGSLIVARGQKTDTLYRLHARHNSSQVNVAEDYPIELWHRRLRHISEKDDHSKKVWAYPMRTKDQVTEIFKNFHVVVERETGMKLKCVRADNGCEYRGPFENYCRNHGIKLEKTVPKTPQQNRLVKRMNLTIIERARCMLSQAKLSKSFRGEAMMTTVDLINLTPSVALDGDVPQQVWTVKKVSYKHLRVFGCRASVHIRRDERSKLDTKAKQCIFLGYAHK